MADLKNCHLIALEDQKRQAANLSPAQDFKTDQAH